MNTDKELLELAAEAAGISIKWDENWNCFMRDARPVQELDSEWLPWRPLKDDGDALRLAVKLELSIQPDSDLVMVSNMYCGSHCEWEYFEDRGKATRRAIVRAAAEIGKTL